MAKVDEVKVKITADTSYFQHSLEKTMDVMLVYALRELAFVKMMAASMEAAFEEDLRIRNIDNIVKATPEELHAMANEIEEELAAEPHQDSLPKEN